MTLKIEHRVKNKDLTFNLMKKPAKYFAGFFYSLSIF